MSRRTSDQLTLAALHDLDPAGPSTDLDEDERARAEATFARVVSSPATEPPPVEPGSPRHTRLPRLLAAAGLLGASGLAGSALLLGGTAYGSWTPTPTPLEGNAATIAADDCRAALDVPDRGEQVLIAEERGDWTFVLLGDPHTEAACVLPQDLVGQDHADFEGKFMGSYDPDTPAAPRVPPGSIDETTFMSGSMDEGLLNWCEGYVGRDVVGVTVHTATGMRVEASVGEGRFAAWWPAGEAKGDNPEIAEGHTFVVHLADGTSRRVTG